MQQDSFDTHRVVRNVERVTLTWYKYAYFIDNLCFTWFLSLFSIMDFGCMQLFDKVALTILMGGISKTWHYLTSNTAYSGICFIHAVKICRINTTPL